MASQLAHMGVATIGLKHALLAQRADQRQMPGIELTQRQLRPY